MTVVAAIATPRFALMGSDSRTFISGVTNSFVDNDQSKIKRLRCKNEKHGLIGFAGDNKFEESIIALLVEYGSPDKVPPDDWPDSNDDEGYNSIYISETGVWLILSRGNIISYPLPCFIRAGSGGELAEGSFVTQTWRRKTLSGLRVREARRILTRSLSVACKCDLACGGKIHIRQW